MLLKNNETGIVTLSYVHIVTVDMEEQLSVTYSQCVSVALATHNLQCYIVICGLSGAPQNVSTLFQKQHYFQKKVNKHKCVF
jgi:hypothetical protein